jgi:hypothetical protein
MDLFGETERQRIIKRLAELKAKRSQWDPHILEIAENMLPRRLRLNPRGEVNRGSKLNGKLLDPAPSHALRTLAAGLMASVTSPARPWLRLTTQDPELAAWGPVKQYLHEIEQRLARIYSMSNFYQALTDGIYPDLGAFGTAVMGIEEDPRRVINCVSMPWGEYSLSCNGEGEVDTCYREIPFTVRQVVTKFCQDGNLNRLSMSTKAAYSKKIYEEVVMVIHAIEPNDSYREGVLGPRGQKWKSTWIEQTGEEGKFLRKSGYDGFPIVAPRWSVTGTDVYGRGPGMDALPDCKELQFETSRRGQLSDKITNPPMKASAGLRGSRATLIPGDVTYLPEGNQDTFEPAYVVDPRAMGENRNTRQELRSAIRSHFYADLWMRILDDDRAQRATATEIEEGKQELMLQLGPVLEHLNPELLRPSVERAFSIGLRLNLFPPPPKEVQGQELQAEFISILHQAQKATGLVAIRTLWGEAAKIAAHKPAVMDKMEADAAIDEIADIVGVNPKLVLDDEGVAKVRQMRAQQEQEAQQAKQAAEMAKGAASLGKTPAPAPDNALGALLGAMGPMAGAGLGKAGGLG